ncbi:interferon-inducible double-stranded RNA-dependent protein kinase activator A homolog [Neocloeon triangulifer]|uniref:interferon-inducible double-stranded RNA-dependent protein kinase activator A homolog n=1 Tax=Neocloeon triangulifer TaxID=2078957 RepID=UPI00286F14AF|nr:interferon-inducible double-stranded RNA-dependent protein kinase activator A homolog [Neocloeon triangulifer]
MTTKTPVSRLQEISMKMKLAPPEYELTFSRQEGLNPSFTFKCIFNGTSAEGSGRTKRDAKHESADALLRLLQSDLENESILNVVPDNVVLPHSNKVQRNFVGELAEYCLEVLHFAERPVYAEVEASGAAHDPTFTMKCTVSNFSAEAKGPTKKQAKQLAAKQVLERLQSLKDPEEMPQEKREKLLDLSNMSEEEKVVIKRVLALHKSAAPKLENVNKTNDIFKQFYCKDLPSLASYPEDRLKSDWDPCARLQDVCSVLGENMLSYYNFNKFNANVNNGDFSETEGTIMEQDQVYFSCSTTVHIRPMNLTCKGWGKSPEECIKAAAERMLFLMFCFVYDKDPFATV